jgi:hypothetical protein
MQLIAPIETPPNERHKGQAHFSFPEHEGWFNEDHSHTPFGICYLLLPIT